ncbi:hypothetical protein [Streptomyces zingiberis]|nr:hypothetical protein [Streptomyces zingiberis]
MARTFWDLADDEDVLLAALEGKRDTEHWRLPVPPPDQQGRPE